MTLMLVNLANGEQSAPLDIKGKRSGSVETWLLDATHNAEQVDAATTLQANRLRCWSSSKPVRFFSIPG